MFDSTCKFSSVTGKRLGPGGSPQSFMRDYLYGTDVDIRSGACAPTLLELIKEENVWNNQVSGHMTNFRPGQNTPMQYLFST
eukprot:8567485-Pyramimonas_sp.AAC.1